MLFHTEYDYEPNEFEYYWLKLTIEYQAHSEERQTREYPGCPAYIEIESVTINQVKDFSNKIVSFSSETLAEVQKHLDKLEWDITIGEYLADTEDFERSEYYDRKRDELRGC